MDSPWIVESTLEFLLLACLGASWGKDGASTLAIASAAATPTGVRLFTIITNLSIVIKESSFLLYVSKCLEVELGISSCHHCAKRLEIFDSTYLVTNELVQFLVSPLKLRWESILVESKAKHELSYLHLRQTLEFLKVKVREWLPTLWIAFLSLFACWLLTSSSKMEHFSSTNARMGCFHFFDLTYSCIRSMTQSYHN